MNSVLWIAVAEARGHLMRALLMRELMLEAGIVIDIATTHEAGRRFVAASGVDAAVLPGGFRLHYDERQNLDRANTRRAFERYLARGLGRDLRWLRARRDRHALVVDDSLHPAVLAAALMPGRLRRQIVNVHGEHLRDAVFAEASGPERHLLARALRRSRAEVIHSLELPLHDRLRPLIAKPRPKPRSGFAAVYLNPRFCDPRLAAAIEAAVEQAGLARHAVGEGFAERDGWRAVDPRLCDAIAAAEVLIAAPGMATLSQAHAYGTPLVALSSDQPEQRLNLRYLPEGARSVRIASPSFARDLREAITAARTAGPVPSSVDTIRTRWKQRFIELCRSSATRRRAA